MTMNVSFSSVKRWKKIHQNSKDLFFYKRKKVQTYKRKRKILLEFIEQQANGEITINRSNIIRRLKEIKSKEKFSKQFISFFCKYHKIVSKIQKSKLQNKYTPHILIKFRTLEKKFSDLIYLQLNFV
jgi:hypothetical protein